MADDGVRLVPFPFNVMSADVVNVPSTPISTTVVVLDVDDMTDLRQEATNVNQSDAYLGASSLSRHCLVTVSSLHHHCSPLRPSLRDAALL